MYRGFLTLSLFSAAAAFIAVLSKAILKTNRLDGIAIAMVVVLLAGTIGMTILHPKR